VEFEVCLDAIEARETAFGVGSEALNAVDVDLVFFDPQMLVVSDIDQAVIASPAIGHDDVLRADLSWLWCKYCTWVGCRLLRVRTMR
jgi:hypothetical protein